MHYFEYCYNSTALKNTHIGQLQTSHRHLPIMPVNARECPCLSLHFLVFPCLSLFVLVCPCLSMYVSAFATPVFHPLQMNITVFISMNIVTVTSLVIATVPMHGKLILTFSSSSLLLILRSQELFHSIQTTSPVFFQTLFFLV